MAWAKVDDGWWCHPKVMGLSLPARGLWVSALSWSCAQRRDVVPATFLAMVGASVEHADELSAAGLWVDSDDGFRIHDWAEYQEKSTSEKRADAGRKGGMTTGSSKARTGASQANRKQTASNDASKAQAKAQAGTHPFPSHPVTNIIEPDPSEPSKLTAVQGSSADADGRFVEFWDKYPRKVDKSNAARSFAKAIKGRNAPSQARLLARLASQKDVWATEGRPPDKIPHAATWLNGRRWEDDDLTRPERDHTRPLETYAQPVDRFA